MANIFKTALGKSINIDQLVLQNEDTIAVGNQKLNARGDQLGPGGKVIKTRDQIMKEYYALSTPIATDLPTEYHSVTQPIVADVNQSIPESDEVDIFDRTVDEEQSLLPAALNKTDVI